MEYITGIEQYAGIENTALTLGKFDGLHKGHQKLIDKICAYSGENCKSVLCAFDMHRESLMTKQERRSHLEGKIDCLNILLRKNCVKWKRKCLLRTSCAKNFMRRILL